MNFLAHFYLSGTSESLVVGNFLGDMIRKAEWKEYSPQVVEGIKMHQHIDFFTDNHPIVKKHKVLLVPKHGHFSGVILDILYDYFLANYWYNYHEKPIEVYAEWVYDTIGQQEHLFTKKAKNAFKHMRKYNWLVAYASTEGLDQVLQGMAQRTRFSSQMHTAILDFHKNEELFHEGFLLFFEDLKKEVLQFTTSPY